MGSLEEDLRRMLTDDSFSDMVFVCGDEQEKVPASRMFVAARSPTLQSMLLTSGMVETKLSHVPLPEMDSSTMHICMEFFYTGRVQSSSWIGLFSIMQVVSAARFLLTPKLEELAVDRLSHFKVLYDDDSYNDLGRAYTFGVKLQHGHHNLDASMQRLSKLIVNDAHSSLQCFKHLSEEAFVHLVQNVHADRRLTKEYVMFYLVVQWCASQLFFSSGDASESKEASDSSLSKKTVLNALELNFPWTLEDTYKHVALPDGSKMKSLTPSMLKVMKLLAAPVVTCLTTINLDLSKIPAQVLSKIIEPLGIVPSELLFAAYKQQALSIPMR